ncbi:MAG: hypothetical protein LBG79_04725 [Spirochaetaceae bacterium]|jgi:photosystem II stability/assembly factor-like uncharacterized protein|nr:hypothetical protein [Spirochaetaceae bacterium]
MLYGGGGGLAAYGAGKWLIVGGGRSVSSTDGGVSWGPVEDAPKKLIQLAFVDNKFIAVCKEDSGDLIYTSSNGSAWSSVSVSVKFSFCNIAFGASKTIIAGYAQPVGGSALSGYYLTNSGSGWTSTPASPFLPRSIVFGNSNFVSADNYYISSSTDGSSWNGPVSPGLSVIIKDIVFFNGYFNLFGQDIYNTTKIYKSSTGAAPWSTPATLPAGEWSAFAVAP